MYKYLKNRFLNFCENYGSKLRRYTNQQLKSKCKSMIQKKDRYVGPLGINITTKQRNIFFIIIGVLIFIGLIIYAY